MKKMKPTYKKTEINDDTFIDNYDILNNLLIQ